MNDEGIDDGSCKHEYFRPAPATEYGDVSLLQCTECGFRKVKLLGGWSTEPDAARALLKEVRMLEEANARKAEKIEGLIRELGISSAKILILQRDLRQATKKRAAVRNAVIARPAYSGPAPNWMKTLQSQ